MNQDLAIFNNYFDTFWKNKLYSFSNICKKIHLNNFCKTKTEFDNDSELQYDSDFNSDFNSDYDSEYEDIYSDEQDNNYYDSDSN